MTRGFAEAQLKVSTMLAADQAESLRRMLAPRSTRRLAVVGCENGAGATTVATGLAHALALQGERVLLVDEDRAGTVATRLSGVAPTATLAQVFAGEVGLDDAVGQRAPGAPAVIAGDAQAWGPPAVLQGFRSMVADARPGPDFALSRLAAAAHHLVIVLRPERESLTAAYACIKRLHHRYACRRFHLVINGAASDAAAGAIVANLARTASQYLGIQADCAGVVPADPLVARSAALGRCVVEAFPGAPSTGALRRIAAGMAGWPLPAETEANAAMPAPSALAC